MTAFEHLPPWMHETLLASLDVLAKATVLILLALATNALLRGRRRVLARSAVYNALLAGLVLLPAASLAFPRLRVPCLPPVMERPAPAVGAPAIPMVAAMPSLTRGPLHDIVSADIAESSSPDVGTPGPTAAVVSPMIDTPSLAVAAPFPWPTCVLAAYLAGAALLIVRLLVSLHAVQRLRRTSRPLADTAWTNALERWQSRLGIDSRVELAASSAVTVPLTFGWLRPMVMIPQSLVHVLDAGRRDTVLLHELAHVRRGDYGWQLLLKCVQAAYWLLPLVWVIGRSISAVRERACDDLCTYHAATPQDYRATLVEVVAQLVRRPAVSLGIAMAGTTKIAGRLERIDAANRCAHCVAARPARVLVTTLALAAAAAIGPIELARRATAEPPSSTTGQPSVVRAPGVPRFRCDEPVYNFPDTFAGDIVEHTWAVHNDGDAVLEILQVRSSCGCMVPSFDKQIQPGGQGKITVTFNTRGYRGDVTKTITVRTNDPGDKPVALQPKGKIIQRISMDPPGGAQFPHRATGADRIRAVTLTNNTDQPLKLEVDTTPLPVPFRYEIKEIEAGKVYSVVATLDEQSSAEGLFMLAFKTGLPEEPKFLVPVNVAPIIQTSSSSLAVATPVAVPFHRELTLNYNGAGTMQVTGVSAGDPGIKVRAVPVDAGRTWKLLVDIPQGWNLPPALVVAPTPGQQPPRLDIVVYTDVKGKSEVKIPVFAYAQRARLGPQATRPSAQLSSVGATRLGFAILPTLDQAAGDDRPTNEQIAQFLADLRAGGPEPGHRRKDEYQWFEAAFDPPPNSITGRHGATTYVLLHVRANTAILPSQGLGNIGLERASAGQSQGHATIDLTLNRDTGRAFRELTKNNVGKVLAALIDDRVVMQAAIRSEIGEHVQISGRFTDEEVQGLVTELSVAAPVAPGTQPATRPALQPADDPGPGRVEGVVRIGGRLYAGAEILLDPSSGADGKAHLETIADAQGRFAFERVPAGAAQLHLVLDKPGEPGFSPAEALLRFIDVKPGETTRVDLGGTGRPVIGRIASPAGYSGKIDWVWSVRSLYSSIPVPYPPGLSQEAQKTWYAEYEKTPEGRARLEKYRGYGFKVTSDGSFRIEDVIPGDYSLSVDVYAPSEDEQGKRDSYERRIAIVSQKITVPEMPGGRSGEPLDLGTLAAQQPLETQPGTNAAAR